MVDERRTPTEVSHRFAEAINAGDLQKALTCWSPAGVLVEPEGQHVRGHSQLAERFQGLIRIGAQLKISVADEVCTEHGSMAATEMQMTIPGDGQATVIEIKAVVLYVPGAGGLEILIDRLAARAVAETPPPATRRAARDRRPEPLHDATTAVEENDRPTTTMEGQSQ